MSAILAIDPAWTSTEPSGVALLKKSRARWRCVALAPDYASFLALHTRAVDWHAPHFLGSVPDPSALLAAAGQHLNGGDVSLVTVDMPVSAQAIVARRASDNAVSSAFGSAWCGCHTPSRTRPGPIGAAMSQGFAAAGFDVGTTATVCGTPRKLLEVYPHPALLKLLKLERRHTYKVSKHRAYWPADDVPTRVRKLLAALQQILDALRTRIDGIPLELPAYSSALRFTQLKRYEDAIDALICGWIGIEYFNGSASAYGDDTSAIWIPK